MNEGIKEARNHFFLLDSNLKDVLNASMDQACMTLLSNHLFFNSYFPKFGARFIVWVKVCYYLIFCFIVEAALGYYAGGVT